MHHLTTIADYCQQINVPPPRWPHFDIRSFEENMKTVNKIQPPFRHEFYAIALRLGGTNRQVSGKPLMANLFFNTPYQIISWEIDPDWRGWYIIFDEEFVRSNPQWANFLLDFPFMRLDRSIPFDVPPDEEAFIDSVFQKISNEYHSHQPDAFAFIRAYTHLLLLKVKRNFDLLAARTDFSAETRSADVLLLSRFQTLAERGLSPDWGNGKGTSPEHRSVSFYADQLAVHPNHLNAVVKRITGKTASQIIQEQLLVAAKSLLLQTSLSVKEIAHQLGFEEPTHFNAFFRKMTGGTPKVFREGSGL